MLSCKLCTGVNEFHKPDSCLDTENFHQLNEWSPVQRCDTTTISPTAPFKYRKSRDPNWREFPLASYRRGPHDVPDWQQDNEWRFVVQGVSSWLDISLNRTWVYHTAINSWIRLRLTTQPAIRMFHTMSTLCSTRVILFGGVDIEYASEFNDTWLFDGVTESWKELDVRLWTEEFVLPRSGHMAVVIRQMLSNCSCQESILIYGGLYDTFSKGTCLNDLWEMRCIADVNGTERFYWILLMKTDDKNIAWPSERRGPTAVDFNKSVMYMWGGRNCQDTVSPVEGFWQYNLTSGMWQRHVQVNNHVPITCILAEGTNFYHPSQKIILTLNSNCMYSLNPSNGTIQMDVIQTINTNNDVETLNSAGIGGDRVIFFVFSDYITRAYNLSFDMEATAAEWISLPDQNAQPLFLQRIMVPPYTLGFIGASFYLQGSIFLKEIGVYDTADAISLWQFDVEYKAWSQTWSPFSPLINNTAACSTVDNSVIVCYTDLRQSLPKAYWNYVDINSSSLWVLHAASRRWTLCLPRLQQQQMPVPRVYASLVDIGNGSLLLFGGATAQDNVNELWRADMCQQRDYRPVRENCVNWALLSTNISNSPSPRMQHSSFMANGSLFVFGGITLTKNTSRKSTYRAAISLDISDLWQFQMDKSAWKKVQQKGLSPLAKCFINWKIAQWGTKVTAVADRYVVSRDCGRNFSRPVVVFDTVSSRWSKLADAFRVRSYSLAFWREKLIAMTWINIKEHMNLRNVIIFLNPACPAGYYGMKWEADTCKKCDENSFAPVGSGQCSPCPDGLTANGSEPKSIFDCVCRRDYCVRGKCIVAQEGDKLRTAVCQCDMGYTGSTCKYPTYYLIGSSVIGVLFLVLFMGLFVKRMIKHRKARSAVEEELSSAHKVWSIPSDEVKLAERIDGETPGSYGEVYRGTYRDLTVAVKHLNEIMLSDLTIKKEFEREVEVMRGIRHQNIVMFLGAGQAEKQENGEYVLCPFLVIEFMSRGTLKNVLDSPEVHLTLQDQVAFALDAAKGMQYLHSLSPPRIHRDMKSANLLVSHSWVVKVSDFGSARVVRREGKRQPTGVSRSHQINFNDGTQLLKADFLLTRDTGTILWRPPEIFAAGHYGTSADVYR